MQSRYRKESYWHRDLVHKWPLIGHYEGVGAVVRLVHFHLIELDLGLLFLLLDDHGSVLLEHGLLRTWMVNEFCLIMLWSRANETFGVYYYAVFEEDAIRRYGFSLLGC